MSKPALHTDRPAYVPPRDQDWARYKDVLKGEPEEFGDGAVPTVHLVNNCIKRLKAENAALRGVGMKDADYNALKARAEQAEADYARVLLENRELKSAADVARKDALKTLEATRQLLNDCLPKPPVEASHEPTDESPAKQVPAPGKKSTAK